MGRFGIDCDYFGMRAPRIERWRETMTDKDQLIEKLLAKAEDGRITCGQCFAIAKECGAAIQDVGDACNDKGIRIRGCQLGCFP